MDARDICTCKDHACPLNPFNPKNEKKDCTACIRKNQKRREIPSCLFNLLPPNPDRNSYYFEDFAREVLNREDVQD